MLKRYAPMALLLGLLAAELLGLRSFRQSLRASEVSWHQLGVSEGRVTLKLIASARLLPRLGASQGASFAELNTAEDFGLEGLLLLLMGWAALSALAVCGLSFRLQRISGRWFVLRVLMLVALAGAPLLLPGVSPLLKALAEFDPQTKLIRCASYGEDAQLRFHLGPEPLRARAVMDRLKSGEQLRFLDRSGRHVPLVFGFSKTGNEIFGAQGEAPWIIKDMDVQPCGSP